MLHSATLLLAHDAITTETSVQGKVGFDSNPTGAGGASEKLFGKDEASIFGAAATAALNFTSDPAAKSTAKIGYVAEFTTFDGAPSENFSTHKLFGSGKTTLNDWRLSAESSVLYIAGSRATLASTSTVNANAISLWRERRCQWQDRAKVQAEHDLGDNFVRVTGTALYYDYLTQVTEGRVAFADRSDFQGGLDYGWKQTASSAWFVGGRIGRQNQEQVPLPNCNFDYSNSYDRLAFGWEVRSARGATISIVAGPDFRRYTGGIDSRVFGSDRSHQSFWCEGSATAPITATVKLAAKLTRMNWLSSTGRSAYEDTALEVSTTWVQNGKWTWRTSGKVHRCDYFPTLRDDWESLVSAGCTVKLSKSAQLNADLLWHRGWNGLSSVGERAFARVTACGGVTVVF